MKHQKSGHASEDIPLVSPFQAALNGPMADALGRGASVFGRSASTLQQEGMRFMTRRLQQNMKAAEQFGACKSLPDLLAMQQRWFADMTRAYSEEWAKCSELMTKVLHESESETGNGERPKHSEPPRRADVREH